jgi:hypothetical protein
MSTSGTPSNSLLNREHCAGQISCAERAGHEINLHCTIDELYGFTFFLLALYASYSHLTLHLPKILLQLLHIHLLCRPANPQPLRLIRFRNHVEVHMIDLLMRNSPIILQYVVVLAARCRCDLLCCGEDLR